jgi:hypothetical protein
MRIDVHECVGVCASMCMLMQLYMCVCMHIHIYMHVCIRINIYLCGFQ